MTFVDVFKSMPLGALLERSRQTRPDTVRSLLSKSGLSLMDFAQLISPAGGAELEGLSRRSQILTRQRFGKVIRLFAPLYLSNECINNCTYCGFSRDNAILRVTLSVDEVRARRGR